MNSDTPKPMQGTWTLTAPDGRTWQAESPLRVVAMESRERVPASVALERILKAADETPDPLYDAMKKIVRTPAMPFPDPVAHSARAFYEAVHYAYIEIQHIARGALAAASIPSPQGEKDGGGVDGVWQGSRACPLCDVPPGHAHASSCPSARHAHTNGE